MSELTNYSELEKFWISLEEDFFQRMDNVIRKTGMDFDKEETKIHELKEYCGSKTEQYLSKLSDEMHDKNLSYKRIRQVFASLEVRLQAKVNEFIGNWLNDGAW